MALTFKVRRENNEETRRFRMDESICTNFLSVKHKIETVFQLPINSSSRIRWRDEEDMITISSDEELVDAIGNRKDDILKLFIQVTTSADGTGSTQSGSNSGEQSGIHQGVFCDGCKLPINGNRFKCILCEDYDLCNKCFTENKHPEHDMLVVRNQDNLPSQLLSHFTYRLSEIYQRFQNKKMRQQRKSEGCDKKAKKEKSKFYDGFGGDCPWNAAGCGADVNGESQRPPGPPPMWGPPPQGWRRGRGGFRGWGRGNMWGPHGQFAPWMFSCGPDAPIVVDSDEDDSSERQASGTPKPEDCQSTATPSPMTVDETSQQNPAVNVPQADQQNPAASNVDVPQQTSVPGDQTSPPIVTNPRISAHVSASIQQMKQMGFTDTNGWITQLLLKHNGDINVALNEIQTLANERGNC